MPPLRSSALVFAFTVMCAGPAAGQAVAPTGMADPAERGYLAASAGAVFGLPTDTLVLSGEYGENVNPHVQAYATFSYFENLMRGSMRDELTALGAALSRVTGTPWRFSGRDRGLALVAGAKYLVGNRAVRPYIGGGAGLINLKRTVSEAQLGVVTTAVFNDFGLGSSDLSFSTASLTRPLTEAVAGVGIVAGSTYVDLGYRYRKGFRLADGLDLYQFSAGVGFKF